MKYRQKENGISVSAVAGTTCVLLSFDIIPSKREGLLGFAIEREDKTENEKYFLKGFKHFEDTSIVAGTGQLFSSLEQPFQTFLWEDFSAKQAYEYIYKLIPVYGKPKFLEYGKSCSIKVITPSNEVTEHAVYFNRGVAGSNAYAAKFKNVKPSDMSKDLKLEALKWLSRGLEEALLNFITLAKNEKYGLRAALYEFEYEPVLNAFKEAKIHRNVDVQVVYDARGQKEKNEHAIKLVKLPATILHPRTQNPNYISHNKFIILLKNGKPIKVWTGSTNITEKGIFGQCNTGHQINNMAVAKQYLDYWECLKTDPLKDTIKTKSNAIQKDLKLEELPVGVSVFFSPRPKKEILKTYAGLVAGSNELICGMFPFSFNEKIKEAVVKSTENLKYILIDKQDSNTTLDNKDVDNLIVYGGYFKEPLYDWMKETSAGSLFKSGTNFIHNKILLIDPLGEEPIVIVGSANFSDNSIANNDENTLVIKGNKDLADIYFTEFYRIFNHHYVRQIAKKFKDNPANKNPIHLISNDTWVAQFYTFAGLKAKRKRMFERMVVDVIV